VTNVRKLQRLLAEQEGGAVLLTDRISQLQVETQDLREQNELLEFRILELEECHDNSSVRSHWPDTRDVWTDTESDDVSDSGVQSLPSSDSDAGIHDMKLDILSDELKGRLQDLIEATPNTADRSCLQQVLALLESWECRPQDSVTAERGPRSSSESNRIIATVLPFTDKSVDGEGDNIKKHLKNSECMQESGIFEETEYTSQGTQTGDLNLEALIWDIRIPFEPGVVGELSAEIQRLNQFRERVEEAGHCCGNRKLLRVDEDLPSQKKELDYCRQRLQVLEDKVRIYESSGDQQARLLAERVQKEVRLSAQVKELSAKVQQLISENKCLEEEKCEMEEAENDTRLRCQKLEVKLVSLSESKADLDSQLQQERRSLGRLRSALSKCERQEEESRRNLNYLEVMLNKYEQRNFDLEEREVDLRHRLEMLEGSIPALVIWNMWRIVQNLRISLTDAPSAAMSRCLLKVTNAQHRGGGLGRPNTALESSVTMCPPCPSTLDSSRFQDVEDQGPRIETDLIGSEEVCRPIEEGIRFQLQDLETEVALLKAEIQLYKESEEKYRERISELEGELFDINSVSQVDGSKTTDSASEAELTQNEMTDVQHRGCTNQECVIKSQELAESEATMKKRMVELELKERAYMETIQRADELWTDMETSYKRRISDSEVNEADMRETIKKLQESEAKLRQAYRQDDENEMLLEKIQIVEENEKMLAERVRSLETEKNQLTEEINQLRDTLHSEQMELEKTKEMVARPLKEELLKERRMSRSLQDEIRTLERDSQHLSRDQEAQINGLKVQLSKMSRDLVDLECTNGELKEEVETLEAKICELKSAVEEQKHSEEKLAIKMSQTIQQREQELEEIKREMRFSLTPTARDELREVDKGVIGKDPTGTDTAPTPAESERSNVPKYQAGKNPSKTPAASVSAPELTSQAPGTAEEVTQQPSEARPTGERRCKCSRGLEQPPPVSTLTEKPVLRRWLLSQTVQRQDCSHWRQC
jgi:outer membrane murein-binding lipoprotein Lpp